MVACDNEWFHTECLKIITVPKGKLYCLDCRKLPKFKRKRVPKSATESRAE